MRNPTKKLGKAISISLLNQIVSSGTNFILGLFLVRILSPVEFGLYGISFAISLFFTGIGNALFLTQMVVRIPDKLAADLLPYTARIFILTSLYILASALIMLLVIVLSSISHYSISHYSDLGLAITSLAATYLLKDFFIRHAYSLYKEKRALVVNISLALALCAIGFFLSTTENNITATDSLIAVSAAQAFAAFIGFLLSGLPLKSITRPELLNDARELFHGGKWSVLAHIIISVRSQAYTLIVASFMGPAGVARLNAARIFITPATMLMPALGQVFLPRIANARATDPRQGRRIGLFFSMIMFGAVVIYSVVVLASFQHISSLVVGTKYQSLFWLVFWWSIYNCITTLKSGQELIIIANKQFRIQAIINAIAAILALGLVTLLFINFAEIGAIIGQTLAEIVVFILMWKIVNKGLPHDT